ncbi:MAG: protein kinase [Pseudomonadota bacterium]
MANENANPPAEQPPLPLRVFTPPTLGEVITSSATNTPYTMAELLGEGSFGYVYACTDGWSNELAAKVLKARNLPYEKIRDDAVAELTKLQAFRHPTITYVYDAFEYRDTFYLITERCHRPLAEIIKSETFKGHLWLKPIARCLLQAIHYLHVNKMVHQDVHLGNVLTAFVKDEMVPDDMSITFKLADLGLTKVVSEVDALNTMLAQWMLPPEVLKSEEFGLLDQRIDIYHAGLLLLQVYKGSTLHFSKEDILAGAPRKLAETLPPPFNTALSKALRRHSHLQTQSALEFWRDLYL